ncbi:MAG: 50S ribosomal protein L9 [Bacillota bacterium]
MRVILKKSVKDLGHEGDTIKVADGYARNYLIPKGLAVEASDSNLKALKAAKQAIERKADRELVQARRIAQELASSGITIRRRSGEGGRLFGSVTSKDVADAIKEVLGVEVDRKKIDLPDPIKAIGSYTVPIKLHPEITARIMLEVQPSSEGDFNG